MQPYLEAATEAAVVAIGVAQEFQLVFAASRRDNDGGTPSFSFYKADRRVSAYYFYVSDADFGSGFIKICSYFPYPGKVWVNGHEWAKRQAHGRTSTSANSPTGSPHVATPLGSSRSVLASGPTRSPHSSTAGWE